MPRTLEFLDEAIEEAEAAARWYAEPGTPKRSQTAAATFAAEIESAIAEITRLPWPDLLTTGGPRWLDTERFDVQGKVEGRTVPFEQLITMLQSLLEDRFHLKTHRETRESPVYALVHLKNSAALKLSDDQTLSSITDPGVCPARMNRSRAGRSCRPVRATATSS